LSLPVQTLHNFVLNLLTDEPTRAAFAADPTAALAGAGLSDVTPQDIQEVAPLVADYAPAPVADALESVLATLPADAGVTDLQGAIAQLQAVGEVANGLPVALPELGAPERSLPVSEPDLGSLPVSLPDLGGLPVSVPDLGSLPVSLPDLGGLPVSVPDLGSLPVSVPDLGSLPVSLADLGSLPVATPDLGSLPVGSDLGSLPVSLPDLGSLPATVSDLGLDGLPVSVPELGTPDLGSLQLASDGSDGALGGTLAYSGDAVSGVLATSANAEGAAVAGASHTDAGSSALNGVVGAENIAGGIASDSALGSYAVDTSNIPATVSSLGTLSDVGHSLDAEVLGRSDPAAGTVASYVSDGGDLVGGQLTGVGSTLGNYLTGVVGAGEPAATAGTDLGTHVTDTTSAVSDHVAQVPVASALPLPAVVSDLPAHVPADLPVHATAELPQALPHLPVANPLPQIGEVAHAVTQPVTDVVSHTGLVGGVTDSLDHSVLPETGALDSLHNDLPLGH
jgi:hypothetical protein